MCRKLTLFFLLISAAAFADDISTVIYHDPTLDTLNGQVGNIDADLNGYMNRNGQWMTMEQNARFANTYLHGGTNVPLDNTGTNFITFDSPTSRATAIEGLSVSNSSQISLAYSNSLVSPFLSAILDTNFLAGTSDGSTILPSSASQIAVTLPGGNTRFLNLSFTSTGGLFDSALLNLQNTGALCRAFIMALTWLGFFIAAKGWLQQECSVLLLQNQTQGSSQEVLGNNASLPVGVAYSILITAGLVSLVGYFSSTGTFINNSFLSFTTIKPMFYTIVSTFPSWDVLTTFVPIEEIFLAFLSWIAFRYIYGWVVFLTVRSVIKFLIV